MATNNHRYGLRWVRSLSGAEAPQVLKYPIATAYAPVTIVGGGVSVNLNVGDPVRLLEDGTIALVQSGQDSAGPNTNSDDYIFGVIAGFAQTRSASGDTEQRSFHATGIAYTGGIGSDLAPVALVIPVANNVFEIDADAALATPTRSGALALSGRTARMVHSAITSGVIGAPKANPLLDISDAEGSAGGLLQAQLVIVGLGASADMQDFTTTGVTFQVMATAIQLHPWADPLADTTAHVYGANVE